MLCAVKRGSFLVQGIGRFECCFPLHFPLIPIHRTLPISLAARMSPPRTGLHVVALKNPLDLSCSLHSRQLFTPKPLICFGKLWERLKLLRVPLSAVLAAHTMTAAQGLDCHHIPAATPMPHTAGLVGSLQGCLTVVAWQLCTAQCMGTHCGNALRVSPEGNGPALGEEPSPPVGTEAEGQGMASLSQGKPRYEEGAARGKPQTASRPRGCWAQ